MEGFAGRCGESGESLGQETGTARSDAAACGGEEEAEFGVLIRAAVEVGDEGGFAADGGQEVGEPEGLVDGLDHEVEELGMGS